MANSLISFSQSIFSKLIFLVRAPFLKIATPPFIFLFTQHLSLSNLLCNLLIHYVYCPLSLAPIPSLQRIQSARDRDFCLFWLLLCSKNLAHRHSIHIRWMYELSTKGSGEIDHWSIMICSVYVYSHVSLNNGHTFSEKCH